MQLKAIQQSQVWADFQSQLPNRQTWQLDGFFLYKLTLSHRFGLHFLYLPGIDKLPSPETWTKIKALAKKENCAFIHSEPYYTDPQQHPGPTSPFHYIEPLTRYLDLSLSEEELLSQMKQKGRYNIRLAQKKGVIVKEETTTNNFYQLFQETTTRDNFSGHSSEYYQTMLSKLGPKQCQLFTAFHPETEESIASLIITYHENTATYYYGASSNKDRNLMAPYLLQWHTILEAKKRGYQSYDFMGISAADNKKHRLAGVSKFKAMFGGETSKFQTAFDIPVSWKYWPYWLYKKL